VAHPSAVGKAVCDEAIRPQDHRHDGKVVFAVPVCGAATQDAAATVPRLTRRPLRQLLRRAKGGVLPRQIT